MRIGQIVRERLAEGEAPGGVQGAGRREVVLGAGLETDPAVPATSGFDQEMVQQQPGHTAPPGGGGRAHRLELDVVRRVPLECGAAQQF